jgi:hypothetical protein
MLTKNLFYTGETNNTKNEMYGEKIESLLLWEFYFLFCYF